MNCPSCGGEIPAGSAFCLHCGARIAPGREPRPGEAPVSPKRPPGSALRQPFLAAAEVSRWRDALGGLEGWSPFFTPPPEELELFARLNPPLDVKREQFLFCREILPGRKKIPPQPPFGVHRVTVRGQTIRFLEGFTANKRAWLLATDSRLLAYNPKAKEAAQVLYEEIVALDVQGKDFRLHLADGGTADLDMRISRPGLLAVMAVVGAPTNMEKEVILRREQARAGDAQGFVALFSRFFAAIIDENMRARNAQRV